MRVRLPGVRNVRPAAPAAPLALVGLDEIVAAAQALAGVARRTPVETSATLAERCDRPIWLKCELRQRTGSFKIRGAYTHIAALDTSTTRVVAASAGNHAQGVALAASLAGRSATIFMPVTAALPKIEATRAYGAAVQLVGETVDDSLAAAEAYATETGAHFVPPFDDPLVIAGQGTLGLEILEQVPEAEVVVVPVGGGGLLAGVAAAIKATRPEVRVVGVEAEGAASMQASLAAGHPVALDTVRTIADGIAVKRPSPLTIAHAAALADDIVAVSDEEIGRALILLLERTKAVVEPAGAVSLAALLARKVTGHGPAVALLSGGNVDPLMLTRLIEHGLSAVGRYLRLRIVVPDRPGALARITDTIARLGLNVQEVEHHRAGVRVAIDEVEVLVTLETRDPEHRLAVVRALRDAGFVVDPI
jgi:threonine dehydratase